MSLVPLDKTFKVDKKLSGFHFAIVVSNTNDSEQRGGINVKIPGVFEADEKSIQYLPLVYPLGSIGGTQDNSSINIPQVGSNVLVEFLDQEDPYSGVYISSFLTKKSFPQILKEDYPNSSGQVWSGQEKLPSWLKINKQQEYIELFLNPSKTILKIDKEGRVFISAPDDISIFSAKSLNFSSEKFTIKTGKFNIQATEINEQSTNKNQTTENLSIKSTSTKLDLGSILKKSISEMYESTSVTYKAPILTIEGIINSSAVNTSLINSVPLEALYVGQVSYAGQTYVPTPIPPIVIPPIDLTELQSSSQIIEFVQDIITSHLTEYASTSEFMKRQSDELRQTFKNEAKKWIGSKDYNSKKEETDLSDVILLAEEYVVAKTSENQLRDLQSKMSSSQLEGQSALTTLESNFSSSVANSHPDIMNGFTSDDNYSELFFDLDYGAQIEILDKYNSTADPEIQLPLPSGYSSFSSIPENVLSSYLAALTSAQLFLVVNGVIFNYAFFSTLSDWSKVNSLTTTTNFKQKNIVPSWSQSSKDGFNTFILTVRKIEIISCKIYELSNLLSRLISAISKISLDLSINASLLLNIDIILPIWIKDLILNIINQIQCGGLPKICSVGSVSQDELSTLPDDLKSLLGSQNRSVTKMYSYEKQYSALINNLVPSVTLLESALSWNKSSISTSNINIIR